METLRKIEEKKFDLESLSDHDRGLLPEAVMKLLGLESMEEVAKLRETIRHYHGMVRVFVHPYFLQKSYKSHLAAPIRGREDFYNNYNKVTKGFERHVSSVSKVPTFVFEELEKVQEVKKAGFVFPTVKSGSQMDSTFLNNIFKNFDIWSEEVGVIKKDYIRRVNEYENPDKELEHIFPKDLPTAKVIVDHYNKIISNDSYPEFMKMLDRIAYSAIVQSLGIKRVIAGGMYASRGHDDEYLGCLGGVVNSFKDVGCKVIFSRYNLGFNGKDVGGNNLR